MLPTYQVVEWRLHRQPAMIGTVALYVEGTGHPWPGGDRIAFEQTSVRALGRMSAYNDFVTRYLVRLDDGREAFVKVADQSKEEQTWLRRLQREINREGRAKASEGALAMPSRDLSFVIRWKTIP